MSTGKARWPFHLAFAAAAHIACTNSASSPESTTKAGNPPTSPTSQTSPASPASKAGGTSSTEPMVLIPGGTLENEPLDAFWLDRDEVGLREYRQCLAAGACNESKSSHDPQSPHPDGSVIAGYAAAARYCSWRGKRLPTAREWIWAARGRDEHRTFPWGEEAPDFGRVFATDDSHDFGVFYDESTPLGPHIVVRTIEGKARRVWRHGPTARGSRPSGASRDGVRDLIGNVQEVVMLREDAYAYIGGSYPTHCRNTPTSWKRA